MLGMLSVIIFKKYKIVDARYTPIIHTYTPKCIIVTCDIVDETVFGGEHIKLLRLITNRMERYGDTIHYDFLHDEYITLEHMSLKNKNKDM